MYTPKNELFKSLLTTFLAILCFSQIDRMILEVSFAPLFDVLLLFVLALFFRPVTVFICFCVMLIYVVINLASLPSFDVASKEQVLRFVIRVLTFSVAGVIATLASFFRAQTGEMLRQTTELLEILPFAIVLSNFSGRVVWVNGAAQRILGSGNPIGKIFLEVLPSNGSPIDYAFIFAGTAPVSWAENALPDYQLRFIKLTGVRNKLLATLFFPKKTGESAVSPME